MSNFICAKRITEAAEDMGLDYRTLYWLIRKGVVRGEDRKITINGIVTKRWYVSAQDLERLQFAENVGHVTNHGVCIFNV